MNDVQAKRGHEAHAAAASFLTPLKLRDITLRSRIAMSPMCQYSADEGLANDWHLVHLGSRAAGGVALIMVEATAVTRDGRITPGDMGIWGEQHVAPLARIARFVESQGAVPGIQLAHAGRKASCEAPWLGGRQLGLDEGGWTTVAPSAIPFRDQDRPPAALDEAGIDGIVAAYEAAVDRALEAGFKVIEIHAAHGYLLHEFLSPLANDRTDLYGGSLENRMRLALRVAEAVRSRVPHALPVFMRISASDWVDGGWDIEQSVALARAVRQVGIDLIDTSSGGMVPNARVPVGPGYQVPFAARIRREAHIKTAAVGMITEAAQADEIIINGDADLVMIARELLRRPYFALAAQAEIGAEQTWPIQYGYAVKRR
jgi:2,4-dienoyl-CoA reductase-like NADH-dependent reductase (Old Yellow Enzyme family)